MRSFGKVGYHGRACDVFAQRKGKFAVAGGKGGRVKHFAQADGLAFGVGQFQPHAGFAWDGFHHANGGYAKAARQIFFQIGYRAAAHAHIGLNFIARDHRASISIQHLHFHLVFAQFFFDGDAVFQQGFGRLHGGSIVLRGGKQV